MLKNNRSKRSGATILAFALFLLGTFGAVSLNSVARANAFENAGEKNIVETAVSAGSFKTLVKVLEAAELVDALEGEGPFTVFAPTDEAFAKIPSETLAELLKPENKEQLRSILLYHVVPGKVAAQDVLKLDGQYVKTLQGDKVKVNTKGGVMVDGARVVKTDITTSNGVIHVIDAVIMPKMKTKKM